MKRNFGLARFSNRTIFSEREIDMDKRSLVTLAAAALIASVSAASAAPGMGTQPSDKLELSKSQQQTAWNDLYMGSLNQETPSDFNAFVGASMPRSVVTAPVTPKAANDVPVLRPYTFAMVQRKLVIVNPTDRKIAAVIAE
jgi:hypothetical protein